MKKIELEKIITFHIIHELSKERIPSRIYYQSQGIKKGKARVSSWKGTAGDKTTQGNWTIGKGFGFQSNFVLHCRAIESHHSR